MEKNGAITYSMDRENEVRKMFITSLGNLIELESTPHSQADRTLEYGLLNQPITAHLVPERYNKMTSFLKLTFSWHMRKKSFSQPDHPF